MKVVRRTIASEVEFAGRGLHSGGNVVVTIRPGENGIRFASGSSIWRAVPSEVTETRRCTKLGEVATIEHLMSAFCGLELTDADVEVRGGELPGLDGSAGPYVDALTAVGFSDLFETELHPLYARVFVKEASLEVAASRGTGHWRYVYDVASRWPGRMAFEAEDVVAGYGTEIAPARTFALEEEVPALLEAGLGSGLDESSVVILGAQGYASETRFPDEPARHKLLDLMGDLYLSGVPARHLNVVAERSGHTSNVRAAALMWQAINPAA